ncbi:hypothetical protein [Endozoicomonas sp.]|uniref:hypothetical protein n=1 Tax=Endozoicomonas sp. TaxID=1892382 RepID=UPI0028883592|nr:hypothetical protein [Endozoicomonas sp.]
MKALNLFTLPLIALIFSLNSFAIDDDTQLQDLAAIPDISAYLQDQHTRYQSDVSKLDSARKGEFTEINDELLSRLSWQEVMAFIRNESTNIETNNIVENFFGWDEGYINRLKNMQQTYDTFYFLSVTYPARVKKLKSQYRGFAENKKVIIDTPRGGERYTDNPINPARAVFRKNNDSLFDKFNSLKHEDDSSQSYIGQQQDRTITGLIGLVTARKIAAMGDNASKEAPERKEWEQMLVQSAADELIKIPDAVATEKRKREQAKAEDEAKKAWAPMGGIVEISRRRDRGDQETLEAAQALSALPLFTGELVTDILDTPWIKPVLNRRAAYRADIATLLSARRGENQTVSASLLNNYGWDITLSLFQTHQKHGLVDKVIQNTFDWDESYVRRLDVMNTAFTIFDRGGHEKGEKTLLTAFTELDSIHGDEPYYGQGLDQLAIGLMGYAVDKQYSTSAKNLDRQDWRKLIMERFYGPLLPLM